MEKIQQLQKEFAAFMATVDFVGEPKSLYDPVAYTLLQSGKRLRPMLCLLACDMFGGEFDDAKYPALALETAHTFTLIHDDVIDQAPMRRGMATVCRKWNTNTAILSGDAALFMAYEFAMKTPNKNECVALLTKVMREVQEGQQYDLVYETQATVTIPEYLEMVRLKTASLLATSLQMGALIAGADVEDRKQLYDFGIGIGMAFQLQDDLLDCYSDVSVFGKVISGDIADNKKTIMFLTALELASPQQQARLKELFSGQHPVESQKKIEEVVALYDALHVKEEVERRIAAYYLQAFTCLDAVKLPEDYKLHLRRYAELLIGREK